MPSTPWWKPEQPGRAVPPGSELQVGFIFPSARIIGGHYHTWFSAILKIKFMMLFMLDKHAATEPHP